jgi:hypothetical protein
MTDLTYTPVSAVLSNMKIRIQRNSVRFRLSKTDVEQLGTIGYLNEETAFGSSKFYYSVKQDPSGESLSAEFANGMITMFVPTAFTKDWATNNVVGIDANVPLDGQESLYLLVEKDFKCLDNVAEDQSDNYENPSKTC